MTGKILVVGPQQWEAVVRAAWKRLYPFQGRMAARILQYMHNLHAGITPQLAAELVRVLATTHREPPPEGVWTRVNEKLSGVFTDEGADPILRDRRAGLVPGAAPFYYVARIATPLVAAACATQPACYLFSAVDETELKDFAGAYSGYHEKLEAQLPELATPELFRVDRAFTLSRLSRHQPPAGIAEGDLVSAALLRRLEPEPKERPSTRRPLRRPQIPSQQLRPLLHRNEGGVDGIELTRRLADLPGILKSEFIHPPIVRLERLLVSGYLALRRPPQEEKRRDLLVVGLMPPWAPGDGNTDPSVPPLQRALIRAGWIDCMARLSELLRRTGLPRTELRWIEGDRCGRWRAQRCLLHHLLTADPEEPNIAAAQRRRNFLALLGWWPGLVDRHAEGRRLRPPPVASDDWAVAWAQRVWQEQKDDPAWEKPRDRGRRRAAAPRRREAYDSVHLMLILPASLRQTSKPSTSIGALRHRFGLPAEPGSSLTATWVPEDFHAVDPDCGWAFSAPKRRPAALLAEENPSPDRDPHFENRLWPRNTPWWCSTGSRAATRRSASTSFPRTASSRSIASSAGSTAIFACSWPALKSGS